MSSIIMPPEIKELRRYVIHVPIEEYKDYISKGYAPFSPTEEIIDAKD